MHQIERLQSLGYANVEIGKKLDMPDHMISGYMTLNRAGEERLLNAALNERIPLGVAMDIARANDPEAQRELLKLYESKQLNQLSIRTVKRLIDQRRFIGKGRARDREKPKSKANAESLLRAFKRESQRQKQMIKKARISETKLVLITTVFRKLLADENFVTLLRAESLTELPKYLNDKVRFAVKEEA